MAAYWLAYTYHQHPDRFLDLDPDEIDRHVAETNRMLDAIRRAS